MLTNLHQVIPKYSSRYAREQTGKLVAEPLENPSKSCKNEM